MDVKAFERAALHQVNYQTTKAGQGFHEGRVKLLGNSAAEVGSFNPIPKHCELFKQPPEPLGDGQATSCWQERASECRVDVGAAGCRGICVGPGARAEGAPGQSAEAEVVRVHPPLTDCPGVLQPLRASTLSPPQEMATACPRASWWLCQRINH